MRSSHESFHRQRFGQWIAETRSEPPELVGWCGLRELGDPPEVELLYALAPAFWGRGYATEAAIATRDAAFSRWRYDHVISLIRPENRPSQRVAERLGMRPGRRVDFHGYEHIVYGLEAAAGG